MNKRSRFSWVLSILMLGTVCATGAGTTDLREATPNVTLWYAKSVEAVGDVNGDGRADLLVSIGSNYWGIVFGRELSGHPMEVDLSTTKPDVAITGYLDGAAIAEMTGDGIADLMFLTRGTLQVVDGRTVWPSKVDVPSDDAFLTVRGLVSSWYPPVVAAGDVDGDGREDLVLGAPGFKCPRIGGWQQGGAVFAFWRKRARGTIIEDPYVGSDAVLCSPCSGPGLSELDCPQFGAVLATGDFNGDGRNDLAIGSPFKQLDQYHQGFVNVFLAKGQGGPFPRRTDVAPDAVGDALFVGALEEFHTPQTLVSGDFDRDGFDDLSILSTDGFRPDLADFREYGGELRLFRGGRDRFSGEIVEFSRSFGDWNLFGAPQPRLDTAAMGDVNGDGIPDVVAGAMCGDGPDGTRIAAGGCHYFTGAGEAYVFLGTSPGGGGPTVLDPAEAYADWVVYGARGGTTRFELGDALGGTVAVGDFDGNGLSDLVVGAAGVRPPGSSYEGGAIYVILSPYGR